MVPHPDPPAKPAGKPAMNDNSLKFLHIGEGAGRRAIALRETPGTAPGLVWLGGYKSDMKGTKAAALADWALREGRACLRFDYSGHGESGGAFTDGTISRWLAESLMVFDACCRGPQILVGSSMGGWLALLLIRELRRRPPPFPPPQAGEGGAAASVAGAVLIAPAVDFTEELMWKRFTPEIKRELAETGVWKRPSEYSSEPYLVTRQLIEDGRDHLLLGNMIETGCPVRILQGVEDPDVPWQHAKALVARLACDDVVLTLIKDGDHRLSRPEDIERLMAAVAEF
jgi:pimeloyl-ACP methyl ester carboxylesterase